MAGILASMVAGGAAGGFKAYGDVIDENVKAKRDAEKEAVLAARQKTLMELSQKFQTSERIAGQEYDSQKTAGSQRFEEGILGKKTQSEKDMLGQKIEGEKSLLSMRNEYESGKPTDLEKQYKFLEGVLGTDVAKQFVLKSKDVKTDLGREKLYSDVYTSLFKAASEMGEVTQEREAKIKETAKSISGFDPEQGSGAKTDQGNMLDILLNKINTSKPQDREGLSILQQRQETPTLSEEEKRMRTQALIKGNAKQSEEAVDNAGKKLGSYWDKLRKIGNQKE